MLQGDPGERMTIPEIFNHIWIRMATTNQLFSESYFSSRDTINSNANTYQAGNATGIAITGNNGSAQTTNDIVKTVLMNTTAMNSLDLLIPISPTPTKVSFGCNGLSCELVTFFSFYHMSTAIKENEYFHES